MSSEQAEPICATVGCGHPQRDHYFGDQLGADGHMHTWCQRSDCHCTDYSLAPGDVWAELESLVDAGNVAYGFTLGSRQASLTIITELGQALGRAQALINEHDRARLAAR